MAGVGLETARQFAEQAARVVLLGRAHEGGAAAARSSTYKRGSAAVPWRMSGWIYPSFE